MSASGSTSTGTRLCSQYHLKLPVLCLGTGTGKADLAANFYCQYVLQREADHFWMKQQKSLGVVSLSGLLQCGYSTFRDLGHQSPL